MVEILIALFVGMVVLGIGVGILLYLLSAVVPPPNEHKAVERYKRREREKAAVDRYKAEQARKKQK